MEKLNKKLELHIYNDAITKEDIRRKLNKNNQTVLKRLFLEIDFESKVNDKNFVISSMNSTNDNKYNVEITKWNIKLSKEQDQFIAKLKWLDIRSEDDINVIRSLNKKETIKKVKNIFKIQFHQV